MRHLRTNTCGPVFATIFADRHNLNRFLGGKICCHYHTFFWVTLFADYEIIMKNKWPWFDIYFCFSSYCSLALQMHAWAYRVSSPNLVSSRNTSNLNFNTSNFSPQLIIPQTLIINTSNYSLIFLFVNVCSSIPSVFIGHYFLSHQ